MVRIIEDTIPFRLEELRRQVQLAHTKPRMDLEGIPVGIAEFETKIEEYDAAGGTGYENDSVRKSDLLSILPERPQNDSLWNSTNPKLTHAEFRDHILTQSAQIFSPNTPVAVELVKWAEHHNMEAVSEAKSMELAAPRLTMEQCQTSNR